MAAAEDASELHIYFGPLVNGYKLTIMAEELQSVS